jgi:hypothetical protein
MKNHVIVMAKDPFQSKVKTRLAKSVGEEAARGIYARLLYDTLKKVLDYTPINYGITLSLETKSAEKSFQEAFPELALEIQCPGNIGVRMQDAFENAFNKDAEKAVLIGTDVPGIDGSILNQAFMEIKANKIVLGPTSDGGYYLVGMTAPGINIFKLISWSSPEVLGQTIKNIEAEGYQPVLLPELDDIDNVMDLRQWQSRLINQKNETNQT